MKDPFVIAGFDLERAIREAAVSRGVELTSRAVEAIAAHARAVLGDEQDRHLTSIKDPREFVERHIGEALTGAAELDPEIRGSMLDMGSGNGYPGLVIGAARPGLRPVLVEASSRKADFLRGLVAETFPEASVLGVQVQRASDLPDGMTVRVVVSRAMGSWERILPRLHPALAPEADLLLWAGPETSEIGRRKAWSRFDLSSKKPLPGRDRSWVWHFKSIRP